MVAKRHEPPAFLARAHARELLDEAENVQQPALGIRSARDGGGLTVCVSRGWTDERRPSGKAFWLILPWKNAPSPAVG
jgi:hypothetical protein